MVVRLIVVMVVALFVAAACSDDDSNDDDGAAASTVCGERANLQQSISDLSDLGVVAEGTNGLNAAVDDVKSDAESLAAVVSGDVADEAEALTDAIDLADETFSTLDDESLLTATAEVALAIGNVAIAADELITALAVECD